MRIGTFDTAEEVFIIAEVGNNHEGNVHVAHQMIDKAVEAGVHAVKFQTFKTELLVDRSNMDRFNKLRSFELSFEQFAELQEHATTKGLLFLSTPLDLESARFLNELVPAFKIASSDNNFYPLLQYIGGTGKPAILSGGMMNIPRLKEVESYWNALPAKGTLAMLHCVTSYPVQPQEANLSAITDLKNNFNCTIGYSDHTLGIDAALASVLLGARIIEKHFTLAHDYSDFRDHQLSADPQEMKILVEKVKVMEQMIGDGIKKPAPSEVEIEPLVRRSIAVCRDLPKGHAIRHEDLAWTRPGDGLPVGEEDQVIGKGLRKDMVAGEHFSSEHF